MSRLTRVSMHDSAVARDNTVIAIFGRKGSGKSSLTREIAHDFPRVIVLDSMAEYGEREGFRVIEGLEAACHELPTLLDQETYAVSVRVLKEQDALDVLRIAYELPDTLLIVEETSLYCSPAFLPEELARLIRYGRHRAISMVFVARRPSEVHRDVTAQADLIVAFRQHEQRDVQYLKAVMGDQAEALRSLPLYTIAVYGELDKAPSSVMDRLKASPQGRQRSLFDTEAERSVESDRLDGERG